MESKKIKIQEKLEIISKLAEEKKAENFTLLNVEGISTLTDRILICSGDGAIHNRAIAKYIMIESKKIGIKLHHKEGLQNGTWILLDFGNTIMHIFDKDTRNYYKLEELWQEIIQKNK
ncbi:MAG: ribosome silencing factor [Candidatus Cloacimonetes bacterium]|nr:ribosome silencing factor [Candidatus Cloacimonadota bacterium]